MRAVGHVVNEAPGSGKPANYAMREVFDLRRLWGLIRSDLIGDYRTQLITAGAVAAAILIVSVWNAGQGDTDGGFYSAVYTAALFIWGAIVASTSFKELHDKSSNEAYLLLPASSLEKTIARLLRATVAFFVFLLVFLTITSAVVEAVNLAVFGRHHAMFNPAAVWVWRAVPEFIVVVSLYFLGAAWFRKAHFVKTALTLLVIPIVLAIVAGMVGRLLFGSEFSANFGSDEVQAYYLAHKSAFDALLTALKLICFIALPIFCWFVAWLRVGETEVSDGV